MSADKTFLGRRMMDFSSSPAFQPFSRVTLWVDDNNCYTAGDDSGRTLEADCPWATQEICSDILARVNGYKYVPYTATDAMLDPAAEIGDGVTVNGRYSVLASIEATFGPMFTATVEAPADEEIDHEFPYKSSASRSFDRKIAQTTAAITVKADQIMAQVESELDDLSSSFSVQLESITSTVRGLDGAVSSIEQKVNSIKIGVTTKDGVSTIELTGTGITASSAKIDLSGFVTFTGLSGGTTTIDGACIKTGTISADRINLTGAITWSDLSKSVQNEFGDGLTEDDVSTLITSELVSSPNIAGGKFKDIKQKNWIEMGQVQTSGGKTTIAYFNHYCSGYSTSNPVFVMGYTNPTTAAANWVMAPFNTIVLDYLKTNETMYASGNWDFSGANVSGLGIDADGVKVVPVWG